MLCRAHGGTRPPARRTPGSGRGAAAASGTGADRRRPPSAGAQTSGVGLGHAPHDGTPPPPGGSCESLLYTFRSREAREAFFRALTGCPRLGGGGAAGGPGSEASSLPSAAQAVGGIIEASGDWLKRITAAWQHGAISDFDYLLYLNLAAGRSPNDITQYPVFPWVLTDYASETIDLDDESIYRDLRKPVGALNPQRLALLRRRMAEMPAGTGMDAPFLYGTHYSTPGYVLAGPEGSLVHAPAAVRAVR